VDIASAFPTAIATQARDAYAAGTQARAANAMKGGADSSKLDPAKSKETAQQFEAMFIGQMLQHMWAGVDVNSEFGGGHGEEMWRSMLIDQYGKDIAKSGKLGIADAVMRQMLKAQEQRDEAAAKLAEMDLEPAATSDGEPADSVSIGPAAAAAAYQMRR